MPRNRGLGGNGVRTATAVAAGIVIVYFLDALNLPFLVSLVAGVFV
jgi:hypothetical protein